MKKSIVASILGVVATVATIESSYGQGFVAFNNYYSVTADQTVRLDASLGGAPVGSTFTAALLYSIGGGALTPVGAANGGVVAFGGAVPAGYFLGGSATIQGYSAGPITFQVQAYNGIDYASSTIRGQSALLNLASISTPGLPVGDLGPGLVSFTVSQVPEPSTLALIGLGTGALLFLRRRK